MIDRFIVSHDPLIADLALLTSQEYQRPQQPFAKQGPETPVSEVYESGHCATLMTGGGLGSFVLSI